MPKDLVFQPERVIMADAKRRKTSSQYTMTYKVTEDHGAPMYALAFNTVSPEFRNVFATAGSNRATVYENCSDGTVRPMQVYVDEHADEDYYTLTWSVTSGGGIQNCGSNGCDGNGGKQGWPGGHISGAARAARGGGGSSSRSSANSTKPHPLLCLGGVNGFVHVIDCTEQRLVHSMVGHGNAINDLKTHPTQRAFVLSASKDEALRIWNIETAVCVAIFAGDGKLRAAAAPAAACV
jgi:polycomb protein EED